MSLTGCQENQDMDLTVLCLKIASMALDGKVLIVPQNTQLYV